MENGKHAEDLLPLHGQQGQVEPAGGPRLHGLRASVPAILAKLRLRALTYYSTAVKAPIGKSHGAVRRARARIHSVCFNWDRLIGKISKFWDIAFFQNSSV